LRGRSRPPHSEHGFFARSIIVSARASTVLPTNHISFLESLLNHVPDSVKPHAILPESGQCGDTLQKSRLTRHGCNVAETAGLSKEKVDISIKGQAFAALFPQANG
jgi:hypothetical protein